MYALFGSPSLPAVKEELKCDGGWSRRFSPHATREVSRARDQSDQQREERGSILVVVAPSSSVAENTSASKDRCKRQESDGYGFKCGYSLGLGSLHRIQVDAARAAFKLSRGHNGALAM